MGKSYNGHVKLRRGIFEHLALGKINSRELGVYVYLLGEADYETGIVLMTSAPYVAHATQENIAYIKKALVKFEKMGYIKRFCKRAQRTAYPIIINKFETSSKTILNADKSLNINNLIYDSIQKITTKETESIQKITTKETQKVRNINKQRNKETKKQIINKGFLGICNFFEDEDFKENWDIWQDVRKKRKCSFKDQAINKVLNKLMKLSNSKKNVAMLILETASNGGWSDIYPLKQEQKISCDDGGYIFN